MNKVVPLIEIDPSAGFCSGVKRAINKAESLLDTSGEVICIGNIVHNEEETFRLTEKGLRIINNQQTTGIPSAKKVMIRAHGEPPSTYRNLNASGNEIVDATCPVVLRLQQKVKEASIEMRALNGKVIVIGKTSHPEVTGLVGQTDGNSIVVSKMDDIRSIDLSGPLRIFAQTTFNLQTYNNLCNEIITRAEKQTGRKPDIIVNQTICRQVSMRGPAIEEFARLHDVVIFVSGSESSNGKYLSALCRNINQKTHIVTGIKELKSEWFADVASIGISGATSTPHWLMQQVANEIKTMI